MQFVCHFETLITHQLRQFHFMIAQEIADTIEDFCPSSGKYALRIDQNQAHVSLRKKPRVCALGLH
jgi:hypothetical protein